MTRRIPRYRKLSYIEGVRNSERWLEYLKNDEKKKLYKLYNFVISFLLLCVFVCKDHNKRNIYIVKTKCFEHLGFMVIMYL